MKNKQEKQAIKQGALYRCPTCNRCLRKDELYCSRCGTKIIRESVTDTNNSDTDTNAGCNCFRDHISQRFEKVD